MAQAKRARRRRLLGRFGVTGRVALGAAAALILVAVTAVALLGQGGGVVIERADEVSPASEPAPSSEEPEEMPAAPQTVLVHVDGAVLEPGVYELAEGSRVNDAVAAAGGLRDDAQTTGLNLAAKVVDGEKIQVPVVGESVAPSSGSEGATTLININTADAETLDELPGVGESTARAIVEDREKNGPFSTPEDLMRVSGIGEKKYAQLEAMICV